MSEALLSATGVVVTVDGARACSAFDLTTSGDRLVLTGDVAPLLALVGSYPLGLGQSARAAAAGEMIPMAGRAELAFGSLSILGRDVATHSQRAVVGAAPLEPPFDPDATILEWLTSSARLAAAARGRRPTRDESARQVEGAIERAQLSALARSKLGALSRAAKRAMVLAHAALGDPRVIVAELPLAGLSDEDAAPVATALDALLEGRASIVSVLRLDPRSIEGGLARRATDVVAFSGGRLVRSGPPSAFFATGRLYRLTIGNNAEPLKQALHSMGLELGGGPDRFSLALPEGRAPLDVLRAAAEVRATVVEIVAVM